MARMQPFASDDWPLHLVHNGRDLHYRELRTDLEARGHRFRSSTDGEVALAAYREWGERCVERFNGMWALAIWDSERERLFCSRDRFGVKPSTGSGGRFEFASELKAFAADSTQPLRPTHASCASSTWSRRTSTTPKRRSSRASCASHRPIRSRSTAVACARSATGASSA